MPHMKYHIPISAIHLSITPLVFTLIFQFLHTFKYIKQHDSEISTELILVFGGQGQHILLTICLVTLFTVFWNQRWFRTGAFLSTIGILFYLLLNHIFYGLYQYHFRLGFDLEGQSFSLLLLKDSILSELDTTFYIGLFSIGAFVVFYLSSGRLNSLNYLTLRPSKLSLIAISGLALYIICSVAFGGHHRQLSVNPIFSFIKSSLLNTPSQTELIAEPLSIQKAKKTLFLPRFGSYNDAEALTEIHDNKSQPNIIYFILESVGAINIFENERLNPHITPNLYQAQNHLLTFSHIYNTFPGTTRAHIPIHTGGSSITWSSIIESHSGQYKGPLLVKALKEQGYETALFSSQFMDFGSLDHFYNAMPFDFRFTTDQMDDDSIEQNRLNSWGIEEKLPFEEMKQWIANHKGDKPFFVEHINNVTHHPYELPSDISSPIPAKDKQSKHQQTIHYMDQLIGETIAFLKQESLDQNTIIVISGDHGQAFGKRHYGNFTHKNHLYEENIRNFLMIYDPKNIKSHTHVSRQGYIGDIMPTLLEAYAGSNSLGTIGQNLLSPQYETRIQYFHKNAYPELWGLVDGEWKFIVEKVGSKNPQLFNLKNRSTRS